MKINDETKAVYIEDTMRQTAMDIRAKFDQRAARETSQADNA